MDRNKAFDIHDLYPQEYSFDYERFAANPEKYVFTPDDIAYFNAMELEKYEQEVPMTVYEKKLLHEWVASGHSPRENAGSKYFCIDSASCDFLSVYRIDNELRKAMKGMSKAEREAYMKEYTGWTDENVNQLP